jgi:hypothetical protein
MKCARTDERWFLLLRIQFVQCFLKPCPGLFNRRKVCKEAAVERMIAKGERATYQALESLSKAQAA